MNDDQRSEFEDRARQVGRKRIPREWRAEILEAALGDGGVEGSEAPDEVAVPDPAYPRTASFPVKACQRSRATCT